MGACCGLKHQITNERAVDHLMPFKQPSFFTSSVMEALTPLLKQPTPSIFEAVTTITSREIRYSFKYLKVLLKFICFTLIYQYKSIVMFLEQAQNVIMISPNSKRTKVILNCISMLTQQINIETYTSRIAQICFYLIPIDFSKHLQQLLLNLILFGNLNPSYVEQTTKFSGVTLPHLNEAKEY